MFAKLDLFNRMVSIFSYNEVFLVLHKFAIQFITKEMLGPFGCVIYTDNKVQL